MFNNIICSEIANMYIQIDILIKDYMIKNNLIPIDIKKYGLIEYHPDKTIYKYKEDLICEVTRNISNQLFKGDKQCQKNTKI